MVHETQNNFDGKPLGTKKPSGDTTSLFVSLYLIVLAFFMVLNSISNQSQTKVKSATDSVSRAFDNPFAPDADFIDVTGDDASSLPNDEFYEQLQGVFASLVGFDEKFPTQGGNVIRVEFSQSDIYEDESSVFRADQNNFFAQLSRFLQSESVGTVREIEYIIYTGNNFPAGPEYWNDISILRSGAIIGKLTGMGVREDQLSIGVSPGEESLLKISFNIRNEISSKQSLIDADRTGLGEETTPMPAEGN
ncbi:MAG: flagellar motor protein MotB [Emcibacteraceae bacterium]|nr:flagellar motor protein MotB [Emcibacteraceae bacterium]